MYTLKLPHQDSFPYVPYTPGKPSAFLPHLATAIYVVSVFLDCFACSVMGHSGLIQWILGRGGFSQLR